MDALVGSVDGRASCASSCGGDAGQPEELGEAMVERLRPSGAGDILAEIRRRPPAAM